MFRQAGNARKGLHHAVLSKYPLNFCAAEAEKNLPNQYPDSECYFICFGFLGENFCCNCVVSRSVNWTHLIRGLCA